MKVVFVNTNGMMNLNFMMPKENQIAVDIDQNFYHIKIKDNKVILDFELEFDLQEFNKKFIYNGVVWQEKRIAFREN